MHYDHFFSSRNESFVTRLVMLQSYSEESRGSSAIGQRCRAILRPMAETNAKNRPLAGQSGLVIGIGLYRPSRDLDLNYRVISQSNWYMSHACEEKKQTNRHTRDVMIRIPRVSLVSLGERGHHGGIISGII